MSEAGYSGTALPKKLGIREASRLLVIHAPASLWSRLEPLPDGVEIVEDVARPAEVMVVFAERVAEVLRWLARLEPLLERGQRLWVAWPKKASGRPTDLTFEVVQHEGLALGLVDTKVCAVDEVWSGLCFMRRRV